MRRQVVDSGRAKEDTNQNYASQTKPRGPSTGTNKIIPGSLTLIFFHYLTWDKEIDNHITIKHPNMGYKII